MARVWIKGELEISPCYICGKQKGAPAVFLIRSQNLLADDKCSFLLTPKKDSFGVQLLTLTPGERGQDKSIMTQRR